MTSLSDYMQQRGISAEQMDEARKNTQIHIDAYSLREARKANCMTQVEMAQIMGISQNRISRMENGDINAMSLDTLRKYVEALGGRITLLAELPTGTVSII
ncbi:helix-turn-helix domain-containing protein [Atopobium fossor]|uniref:helix-turn-helix domain-containing protein n=1 Tax=Atopobium fossor TaxID=39487 RepID=UPI0004118E30|nr:helix-turn-helix transcriptional regulator [Atopobium fossor]